MKSIMFTDLHLKDSFLKIQKKFFFILLKTISNDKKIKRIYFLGDLFDNRKTINLEQVLLFNWFLERAKKYNLEIFLLSGNHDKRKDNDEKSFLNIYENIKGVKVFSERKIYTEGNIIFVPYFNTLETVNLLNDYPDKDDVEYIMMHNGFYGAKTNGGFRVKKEDLNKDLLERFPNLKKVFVGHYHKKHSLFNGLVKYIGNPMQLNFGEDEDKGYYLFDENKDTLVYKRLHLTNFKTFFLQCNNEDYIFAFNLIKDEKNKNSNIRLVFKGKKEKILSVPEKQLKRNSICLNLKIDKDIILDEEERNLAFNKNKDSIYSLFKEYSNVEKLEKEERIFCSKKIKEVLI